MASTLPQIPKTETDQVKPARVKSLSTTKWGTACAQCASAKAKCSRQLSDTPGSKCDRCERLLKQCTDQVQRPRRTRQSRNTGLRTPERRGTPKHGDASTGSNPGSLYHDYTPPSSQFLDLTGDASCLLTPPSWGGYRQDQPFIARSPPNYGECNRENGYIPIPETYLSYAPPRCAAQPQASIYAPQTIFADEELLSVFCTELMPQYPFVVIPQHFATEAAQLFYHERPFLLSAVRMVAQFRNSESMRGQMFTIMSYLADHMLLRAERSLDLLLGVIVVLGWYHQHCMQHSQLNNLLCLAESLVADLRLNEKLKRRSSEEKRALLAVWYLRSCAAVQFHQTNPLPLSAYMKQCVTDLMHNSEFETDGLLVCLIRLQHLTEHVSRVKRNLSTEGHDGVKIAGTISSFQTDLGRIATGMPQELKRNPLITTSLNSAALHLHELCLMVGPGPENSLPSTLKNWIESWLASVPVSGYHTLPMPIVYQLLHAMSLLGRLAKSTASNTTPTSHPADFSGVGTPMSSQSLGGLDLDHMDLGEVENAQTLPIHPGMQNLCPHDMLSLLNTIRNKCAEASQSLQNVQTPTSANSNEQTPWVSNFWDLVEKKAYSLSTLISNLFGLAAAAEPHAQHQQWHHDAGSSTGTASPSPFQYHVELGGDVSGSMHSQSTLSHDFSSQGSLHPHHGEWTSSPSLWSSPNLTPSQLDPSANLWYNAYQMPGHSTPYVTTPGSTVGMGEGYEGSHFPGLG